MAWATYYCNAAASNMSVITNAKPFSHAAPPCPISERTQCAAVSRYTTRTKSANVLRVWSNSSNLRWGMTDFIGYACIVAWPMDLEQVNSGMSMRRCVARFLEVSRKRPFPSALAISRSHL
eukprot:254886-Amphidinium_carterae.2